jgi:hypothetical protein
MQNTLNIDNEILKKAKYTRAKLSNDNEATSLKINSPKKLERSEWTVEKSIIIQKL